MYYCNMYMYVLKFLLRRVSIQFQTLLTFTYVYPHIVNWNIFEYITMKKQTHTCVIYWNKMNHAHTFIFLHWISNFLDFYYTDVCKVLNLLTTPGMFGPVFRRLIEPHTHHPLTLDAWDPSLHCNTPILLRQVEGRIR